MPAAHHNERTRPFAHGSQVSEEPPDGGLPSCAVCPNLTANCAQKTMTKNICKRDGCHRTVSSVRAARFCSPTCRARHWYRVKNAVPAAEYHRNRAERRAAAPPPAPVAKPPPRKELSKPPRVTAVTPARLAKPPRGNELRKPPPAPPPTLSSFLAGDAPVLYRER